MPGSFLGIETAGRALRTNQSVVDIIGHNVSNVNTPGYSRQLAEVITTDPVSAGVGIQLGTGIDLAAVTRARDEFVELRLQKAGGDQSKYGQLRDILARVQGGYGEPGTGGINSLLTGFFNNLQEVARNPEQSGPRTVLRHQAELLSQQFHSVTNTFDAVDADIRTRVGAAVDQVNDLAKQVATLNAQIQVSVASGDHANDLADRRDELVRQLGGLAGATQSPSVDPNGRPTGAVEVRVGGLTLVTGDRAVTLPGTFQIIGGSAQLTDGTDMLSIETGDIAGLLRGADAVLSYRTELNTVASSLITAVNTLHRTGYGLDGSTGQDFFAGTDAANIGVSAAVKADVNAIAAATMPAGGGTVAAGNGENARAMAALADAAVTHGQTLKGYYSSSVTRLGAEAKSNEDTAANQDQVVQQLQNMRNSTSGVSLDEELTHMLQYQRSYQAAARMLSTFDSMLEDILNVVR